MSRIPCACGTMFCALAFVQTPVLAQSPDASSSAPNTDGKAAFSTLVVADRPITAASSLTVREQDLRLRPIQRTSDLLRVAPGLITIQHAGGGKANQYLLRGFDADHGTDVALTLDGVPINMVSHAHGQGYADSNFVLPEIIERIEVFKGPYFAELGDFATAGAINLVSKRSLQNSFASLQGGMYNTLRGVVGAGHSFLDGRLHALVFGEGSYADGPFENPERSKRFNAFGKLTYDIAPGSSISLAITSYAGDWFASGQIPARAVENGLISRFGSLDPSEGGASFRYNVYLAYQLRNEAHDLSALVYYSRYSLKLYSNFTLFSRDPENGDGIEQADDRDLLGFRVNYRRRARLSWLGMDTSVGLSGRLDVIHNSLFAQRARERRLSVVDHDIRQSSLALYIKEELRFSRWLRLIAGLRADYFVFDVNDRQPDVTAMDMQGDATSGVRGDLLVSPKATLVVSPHRLLDLFANFGRGFHSNDARGVVRRADPVTPLTAALGYELGARTRLWDRLDLAASLWGLELDSELVWVGDEGVTEAAGATRRLGLEFEGRLRITDWLFADLDLTLNDAKFVQNAGNGSAVALAPRVTVAAGLSALLPFGLRAALRFTGIDARPATEDGFLSAEGVYLLDAFASYRYRMIELGISVENLTNSAYRSAQFATTSRLAGEAPTSAPPSAAACPAGTRAQTNDAGWFVGCEDVNFTPGTPIQVQARATLYF
ncbi:MAG: TonB-dependent receptor [Myxococcales bacterium]|nr:TonB-dependent receptor [Myxococcales bacterium]